MDAHFQTPEMPQTLFAGVAVVVGSCSVFLLTYKGCCRVGNGSKCLWSLKVIRRIRSKNRTSTSDAESLLKFNTCSSLILSTCQRLVQRLATSTALFKPLSLSLTCSCVSLVPKPLPLRKKGPGSHCLCMHVISEESLLCRQPGSPAGPLLPQQLVSDS